MTTESNSDRNASFRCPYCGNSNDYCECSEHDEQPQDEDLVTKDYVTFYRYGMGGRIAFVVHGYEHVFETWQHAAKTHMNKTNCWPNVWLEEERGGYRNIAMEGP